MEAEFNVIVPPPATTIIVPEFNEAWGWNRLAYWQLGW
jgi:hypothetical protein